MATLEKIFKLINESLKYENSEEPVIKLEVKQETEKTTTPHRKIVTPSVAYNSIPPTINENSVDLIVASLSQISKTTKTNMGPINSSRAASDFLHTLSKMFDLWAQNSNANAKEKELFNRLRSTCLIAGYSNLGTSAQHFLQPSVEQGLSFLTAAFWSAAVSAVGTGAEAAQALARTSLRFGADTISSIRNRSSMRDIASEQYELLLETNAEDGAVNITYGTDEEKMNIASELLTQALEETAEGTTLGGTALGQMEMLDTKAKEAKEEEESTKMPTIPEASEAEKTEALKTALKEINVAIEDLWGARDAIHGNGGKNKKDKKKRTEKAETAKESFTETMREIGDELENNGFDLEETGFHKLKKDIIGKVVDSKLSEKPEVSYTPNAKENEKGTFSLA